jgi:hypothetical protein
MLRIEDRDALAGFARTIAARLGFGPKGGEQ